MTINWSTVAEHAIGIILGGGVTIAGLWFKEFFDRRRQVQSWYEENYIREGIDRVISFVDTAMLELASNFSGGERGLVDIPPYPIEAITRLQTICQSEHLIAALSTTGVFTKLVSRSDQARTMAPMMQVYISLLRNASPYLLALQKELIEVRVKRKSDIYSIRDNEDVSKILALLEGVFIEGSKGIKPGAIKQRQSFEGR